MTLPKPIYYTIIFFVFLCSFFLYSPAFYPLLNSDDALNILIAHYYKLPDNFYCWGQDRGGTLLPLVSQAFIRLFKLSPIISISISNYLILILGYLGISTLFKKDFYKIILAIVWFLPFQRFIDFIRFPIGMEYSLIACAIYFISKLEKNPLTIWHKHLWLFIMNLILIVSVWVSDLSMVSIAILLLVELIYFYRKKRKFYFDTVVFIYVLIGIVSGFIFIRYAKSFSDHITENYLSFNGFNEILLVFQIILKSVFELLVFKTQEWLISVYVWFLLIFIASILFFAVKKKLFKQIISEKWIVFFLLDFIIILGTIFLSSWVLQNDVGRWYFVASYISFALAVLLTLDRIGELDNVKLFKVGLTVLVLVGALTPVYSMLVNYPNTLKPKSQVVRELSQLGELGLIAGFWDSYIMSCVEPEKIKATPHDKSNVRNQELVDEVFARKDIYVIGNGWLKSFPDTLEQFGYMLLKENQKQRIAGVDLCKYRKVKLHKRFHIDDFMQINSSIIVDTVFGNNVIFASRNCDSCQGKYISYGPFNRIGAGEFYAGFFLKAEGFQNDSAIALLDIVADWSTVLLAKKEISRKDFESTGYNCINLDFKTEKRYNVLEFRVFYYGNADLSFQGLELTEY